MIIHLKVVLETVFSFDILGTYSEVWEAKNRNSEIMRAVKIVKKHLLSEHVKLLGYINTEIVSLARVVIIYII